MSRGFCTVGNFPYKIRTVFASKYKSPGLIFRGAIKRRDFYVTSLGGLYLEGLIHGGTYVFGILRHFKFEYYILAG